MQRVSSSASLVRVPAQAAAIAKAIVASPSAARWASARRFRAHVLRRELRYVVAMALLTPMRAFWHRRKRASCSMAPVRESGLVGSRASAPFATNMVAKSRRGGRGSESAREAVQVPRRLVAPKAKWCSDPSRRSGDAGGPRVRRRAVTCSPNPPKSGEFRIHRQQARHVRCGLRSPDALREHKVRAVLGDLLERAPFLTFRSERPIGGRLR